MLSRPVRFAGLVIVIGLAAGGCSAKTDAAAAPATSAGAVTPSASPSDSRTPLQILTASIPTEKSPIYHFSVKSADAPETGVVDPTAKIAEYDSVSHFTNPTYSEEDTTLLTKQKSWLRVWTTPAHLSDLENFPRTWMLLDTKKAVEKGHSAFLYDAESDPGYTNEVFGNATDVSQTSPGHFTGVTDLSSVSIEPGELLSADHLTALGSKAADLKFTAVVDAQGHETTMSLQLPAAGKFKASSSVVTYDHYGAVAVPKIPTAAQQVKAPADVYQLYF